MENTLTTNHKQNLFEIIFYLLLTLSMRRAYFERKTHLSIVSSVDARWEWRLQKSLLIGMFHLLRRFRVFGHCFRKALSKNTYFTVYLLQWLKFIYDGLHKHHGLKNLTITRYYVIKLPRNSYFLPTYLHFTTRALHEVWEMNKKTSGKEINVSQLHKEINKTK